MSEETPPISRIRHLDTCRLIPSKYGDMSVLSLVAEGEKELREVQDLDSATNDRLLAQAGLLPGVDRAELVTGIAHAEIVNAAFTHANPLGSRFSGSDRGAWYAGLKLATAQAEVAFHKTVQLVEVGRLEDDVTYDVYLADLAGDYHDLRNAGHGFAACLDPQSYVASQSLAARLLHAGSMGIIYPSVRDAGGTCISCFRPAAVANVQKGSTYRFKWAGDFKPTISLV